MNKLKNIIVLKGMSSNVVDEAIVILKPNIKLKQSEYMTYDKCKAKDEPNRRIIQREAEEVIKTYIDKININIENNRNKKMIKRYEILKIVTSILIITNIVLIINIF